jgi:hypothetical protein
VILGNASNFRANDIAAYAWGHLAVYQNVAYTAQRIIANHRLPERHWENARRQAKQIRYCLIQAKEYFDAAKAVTLSTRPALLYYCAMSLALTEILMKQSGDSRLERLRETNGAHGLVFRSQGPLKIGDTLTNLAQGLVAKQQLDQAGSPWGTFEIWRRSSREHPLCGFDTRVHEDGRTSTSGFAALMFGANTEPPTLPLEGITLLNCLERLPQMATTLHVLGSVVKLVRTTVERKHHKNVATLELMVHPARPDLMEAFAAQITFYPSADLGRVRIVEYPSGFGFSVEQVQGQMPSLRSLPYCIVTDTKNVWFECGSAQLNEFGLLYVALHICGNFARYFPDKWLDHVEQRSALCVVIERLLDVAAERLPLLCASELTGSLLVQEF